ncbi:MAG: TonB-dependent receptor, partial [Bacteroidota bacterium]|nr:TonB-dependent receptor [Bacteroidota bacterium]
SYSARYGDLATAGAGEFKTLNYLDKNRVQAEAGLFNTWRGLGMFRLLDQKHFLSKNKEHAYLAAEYKYSDAFFESPQNFNRLNVFGKYYGRLNNGTTLSFSASTFGSRWDASGQIPQRKVEDESISRYGSIDDSEGGSTRRTNLNLITIKPVGTGFWKNQFFYSKYDFNLFSNFTFFLNDPDKGDQIRQTDNRHLLGFFSAYDRLSTVRGRSLRTNVAVGSRYDNALIQLSKSTKRTVTDTTVIGKLNQLNTWTYVDNNLQISDKLRMNIGARFDLYYFDFKDLLDDSATGTAVKSRTSPKLSFMYALNKNVEFYLKSGIGFHSNDARAVVLGQLNNSLPRAYGIDAGTTFKPHKRLLANVVLWGLDLESELIYVGDEGIVEVAGRTRRAGLDVGIRYEVMPFLYADVDVNYSYGRLRDETEGANYIPLSPWLTSAGGLSYKKDKGLQGSLRYRYIADRPANETNTVTAEGYLLLDAVISYSQPKYSVGLVAEN